jgi:hypothetical protein
VMAEPHARSLLVITMRGRTGCRAVRSHHAETR